MPPDLGTGIEGQHAQLLRLVDIFSAAGIANIDLQVPSFAVKPASDSKSHIRASV